MDPQNLINQFSQQFGNGDAGATQVNVVSISANALAGITTAIAAQNKEFQKLEQQMKDLQNSMSEENRKARQSEITNDTNEERRQRAARAAVMGKIDKGFSATELALNGLKTALDKFKNIAIENFKRSVDAFQDLAKELRRANLTREQKNQFQEYTTVAQQQALERYGVKLMGSEINDSLAELVKSNKDVALLRDEQRSLYAVLRKKGVSEEIAYNTIMGVNSKNVKDLEKTILSLSDYNVSSRAIKQIESLTAEQIANMGGYTAVLADAVNSQKSLAEYRAWLNADAAAEIGVLSDKLQHGLLETVSESDKNILAAFKDARNEEELLDVITSSNKEQINTLIRIVGANGGFSSQMQQSLATLSTLMENNPDQIRVKLRDDTENAKANEQNTAFGRLAFGIDNLTRKLFGGILGPMANLADEWFGDNLSISAIVTGGFAAVGTLLKLILTAIRTSGINGGLSGAGGTAASAAGTSKLGGFLAGAKGKLGSAGKFLAKHGGKAGVIGAIATLGFTAKDIYDIYSAEDKSVATSSSSSEFKDYEKKLQTHTKDVKALGAATKGALVIGAGAAGAKIGAMLGAAGGPIGMAIGAGVGASIGVAVNKVTSNIASLDKTKINAENLQDIKKQILKYEELSKSATGEQQEWLQAQLEQLRKIEKNTSEETVANVFDNFKDKNSDFFENDTSKALSEVSEYIKQSSKTISDNEATIKQLEIDRQSAAPGNIAVIDEEIESLKTQNEKLNASIENARKTAVFASRQGIGMEDNEGVEDFIKRVVEDKMWWNEFWWGGLSDARKINKMDFTGSDAEANFSQAMADSIIDMFENGVWSGETIEHLKTLDPETFVAAVKSIFDKTAVTDKNTQKLIFEKLLKIADADEKMINGVKEIFPFATGGIVNKATSAVIGEDGKEAVLPLTKPGAMAKVLGSLSNNEKLTLIKSLLSSSGPISIFDFIKALLGMAFNKPPITGSENTPLSQTALSKNIIAGAAAQRGHSYAEMVCNQLVEAALNYAGFKPPITGSVYRHFNHNKMHIVLNDPVNGIDPNDPALLPGMILFSHPFTAAEAMHYNNGKNGPRKAGDPGHMGIYAGNGLWWNSTSSKNTVDYSSGKGIRVTDSNKGFGVALTKPFRTGTYKLYAAGYYDGMFDSSAVSNLPSTSADNIKSREYAAAVNVASTGLLSESDIQNVEQAAGSNASYIRQYIEQANKLLNSSNKGDIVTILLEIARYLKGIASAPANKPKPMAVGRPIAPIYQ